MLKKITLIAIIICLTNICNAQSNLKYSYPVKIDYQSGIITMATNKRGFEKRLNVGEILQISLINLPKNYSVNAVTVFENDKMESASLFNSFINTGIQPKENSTPSTTPSTDKTSAQTSDSIQKKIEKIEEKIKDSINSKIIKIDIKEKNTDNNDKSLRKNILNNQIDDLANKSYKTDIDNLQKSMELGEVKNYLNALLKSSRKGEIDSLEIIGNNASLKKAIVDLKYQQEYLLKYAQENINDRKFKNDSIRENYSKQIDSLQNFINQNKTLVRENVKNLIGVQVLNRDYTNITIEIKDSQNKVVNVIPISFNNHKGFKIDFSTGVFNTFRKIYSYNILNASTNVNGITTANDSTFKIKELSNGSNNLSIGILLHGYWRHFDYANFGPSLGFSYSLDTKDLNLLVGGSLLLGKEQRFIINTGVSFTKTKGLTLYNTTEVYHKSVINASSDLKLSSRMIASPYVGITYNLGAIKTKTETRILY